MKRELFVDYAKGFATICIIFIHTVFWSGQFYVPTEMRALSLLFDVPLFFALSGLTSGNNIEKTVYRLIKLQITYMIFVTGLFFVDYFFKVFGLSFFSEEWLRTVYLTFGSKFTPANISSYPAWDKLGNWYLHSYSNADIFPVVMGSFWYLKVYFIVSFLGVVAIRFFFNQINMIIFLCIALTLIFNANPSLYPGGQVGYVVVYLCIFLIATKIKHLSGPISIKLILVMWGVILIAFVWLFSTYGFEIIYSLNKKKFPPQTEYIIWASLSLGLLFTMFRRIKITKEGFLVLVGQQAIFYYFAQGVSSSLLYFIVVPVKDYVPWYVSLPILFCINILMAIQLAKLFRKTDTLGWNILNKIRNIISTK